MSELMDILYSYAQDYMLRGLLDREPEYANVRHCADKKEQALRTLVAEEHKQSLDDLLAERKLLAFFEGEALFRAGFQIAMELTR